jgi:hypothetical protein
MIAVVCKREWFASRAVDVSRCAGRDAGFYSPVVLVKEMIKG